MTWPYCSSSLYLLALCLTIVLGNPSARDEPTQKRSTAALLAQLDMPEQHRCSCLLAAAV